MSRDGENVETPDAETSDAETPNVEAVDPRVRPARPAEADAIRTLQSHLRRPSPDLLEYGLAVGAALVSVADGRVAGYALPVDARTRPGIHLAELVVAPEHRREGRARGLLRRVVADADGPVTLQAHPGNEAAIRLYEGTGFEVVERRPDAYDDADGLLFRRE